MVDFEKLDKFDSSHLSSPGKSVEAVKVNAFSAIQEDFELQERIESIIQDLKILKWDYSKCEEFKKLNEKELFYLAMSLAWIKPFFVAEYLELFKQTNPNNIFKIAKVLANRDGSFLMEYFENFNITDEEQVYELVNIILDKKEEDFMGEDLVNIPEEIIEEVLSQLLFTSIDSICKNWTKLGLKKKKYMDAIRVKISKYDKKLFDKYKSQLF